VSDDGPDHPLFAAVYDPVTWAGERFLLSTHREWLAADLRGTVLEVGEVVELDRFRAVPPVDPLIRGIARPRGD